MIINKVNVRDFINDSKEKLASGSDLKEALELSLTLLKLFCDRLAKDSRNSSRPPSSDPLEFPQKTGHFLSLFREKLADVEVAVNVFFPYPLIWQISI